MTTITEEPSSNKEGCSLSKVLTVVITSSPAKSNPSLRMLEIVVESFERVQGLKTCRIIIMCDGYKRGAKHRPSRGIIDDEAADRYDSFLENLSNAAVTEGEILYGVEVVVQPERMGFGFAVKRAVEDIVTTDFVMVVHHDQRYVRSFDLAGVLSEMHSRAGSVNYVGVLSPGTIGYEKKCQSSKGVPDPTEGVIECKPGRLVPLFVWFDRNHIASVAFYREHVFRSGLVRKGTFIEDCYGQHMKKKIKEKGLSAHTEFGCYFLDDGIDESMIHHIDGRRWMTPEQRSEMGLPLQAEM